MKPVEDVFSSDVFRRVVLPGIVLTAGFHPLMYSWLQSVTSLYGIGATALVVAEIVVLGLAASSAIQWIYYVYEGFRLEWLTSLAWRMNRARVQRLQTEWRTIQAERDFDALSPSEQTKVSRIYEYLLDFPLTVKKDNSAEHIAERPTRLGNIIATYEMYTESRYGIDGAYFWNHFLNLASDSSRKGFEDAYVFAESLVLASFAGALVALLHIGVLVGFGVGAIDQSLILFHVLSGPSVSGWLVLFGVLVWFVFYQASLPAHREAGAALRAIVDAVLPKFVKWAKSVQVPLPDDALKAIEALNEYLKGLARPTLTPPNRRLHPTAARAKRR